MPGQRPPGRCRAGPSPALQLPRAQEAARAAPGPGEAPVGDAHVEHSPAPGLVHQRGLAPAGEVPGVAPNAQTAFAPEPAPERLDARAGTHAPDAESLAGGEHYDRSLPGELTCASGKPRRWIPDAEAAPALGAVAVHASPGPQ